MVAPNQGYPVRVAHLEAEEEEEEGLEGVEAAVNEVAHKDVVGLRHVAADAE